MKKLFLLFTLVLFICANTSAQSYQDVVYLKSGDIVRGDIIEKTGEYIRLRLSNGDVKTYEETDVESVSKSIKRVDSSKFPTNGLKKGYRGFVDAGYSIGTGDNAENRIEISTVHGYQICPYVFVGLGVGLNYYHEYGEYYAYGTKAKTEVPLFLDCRVTILNRKVTPFFEARGGYSVGTLSGYYYSFAVGCRFLMKNKSAFNIIIGPSVQELDNYQKYVNNYYRNISYDDEFHALTIKIGLDF